MAKDVSDTLGTALGNAAREAAQNLSESRRKAGKAGRNMPGGGKALAAGAAGAGLAALAPLAGRSVSRLASGGIEKVTDAGTGALKNAASEVSDDVGGKLKDEVKGAVPGAGLLSKLGGSGGDDDDSGGGSGSKGVPGVGKGRRMPVQQDIDIGVPVSTVYNEWTQFENWPEFMHRLTSASQQDETHIAFKTKVWGKTKEFTAEITEQRPDERIEWRVVEGVSHTGVVTFHELAPRLTRVEVNLDVQPGSLIEKAARGMRFVKRAVRADLARFKAHVLMENEESGEWRGEVEDAEVKSEGSSGDGASSQDDSSSSRSSSRRSSAQSSRGSSSRSGRGRDGSSGRSRSTSSNGSSGSGRRRAGSHS